ncbi:MAG TPA: fumarylacetoacetate hydrolase family protein [Clostridiaceae bacterium]|nr:fumarylacetoacetate hydrolase family protein [Clostridiaceae bacterium]
MKLCTFISYEGTECVGLVKDNKIYRLSGYKDMIDLIQKYNPDKIERDLKEAYNSFSFEEVTFMAPVTNPRKLIFIGLNYRDHIKESNSTVPEFPVLFAKFSNSLIGNNQNVIIPRVVNKCDFEAELAFVVGKTAKNVDIDNAMEYVFGYTICNDVSARDLQFRVSQWLSGKAIDTFAPMGPVIVTADEIKDPHNLDISCRINGELRQKSNTRELIFNIPYLISYISKIMTLEPGDIISTGTPQGVILGAKDQVWLREGDVCEIEIKNIGVLRNVFINEK